MNKYEPSLNLNTPSVLDKHVCPFTSEEAENLSGMVANRLALFEKNKTNFTKDQKSKPATNIFENFTYFPDNPCGKTSIKQTMGNFLVLNKRLTNLNKKINYFKI
jgi:hypothetical protein